MNLVKQQSLVALLGSTMVLAASASELTTPNSFTSGSRAVAAEVNANFTAVEDAVNDNNARIGVNETAITDLDGRVSSNEAVISDNSDAIGQASMADAVAYAASVNGTVPVNSADAIVKTLTVSAPVDGHVVITYTSWFICTSSAACVVRCTINEGGSTLDTQFFTLQSVPSDGYGSLSTAAAMPVTAGDTVFNAVCDTFTGTGSVGDPSLIAAFSSKLYSP